MLKLGVDHIDFTISKNVELHLLKKSFLKFGAVGLPMHMAMWAIASQIAQKYDTTIKDLKKLNPILNKRKYIYIGQVLKLRWK